jgi:hypothetical protein
MDSQAASVDASSLGREVIAGVAGAGIAVACMLPIPIVHLVAMPLGPFLGGFVAGNMAKPAARGRAVIAIIGVSGVLAILSAILLSFAQKDELPTWFPAKGTLAGIIVGVWFYEAVMAAVGATVSVTLAQKKRAKSEE